MNETVSVTIDGTVMYAYWADDIKEVVAHGLDKSRDSWGTPAFGQAMVEDFIATAGHMVSCDPTDYDMVIDNRRGRVHYAGVGFSFEGFISSFNKRGVK